MTSWFWNIAADLRKGGDESKRARKQAILTALVFMIGAIFILDIPAHVNAYTENLRTLTIPLCDSFGNLENNRILFNDWERLSDYYANVEIEVPNQINIEDNVTFSVKISGVPKTIPLEEPFYYIFLVDVENNQVKAVFPHMYARSSTSPSCASIPFNRRSFNDWSYYDYPATTFKVPLKDGRTTILTRNILMGNSDNIIKYNYNLDKEGDWEIWLYLFENKPKNRVGDLISNPDNYPIEIKKARFDVGHAEKAISDPFRIFSIMGQLFGFAAFCFGIIYNILKKYWDRLVGNIKNNKYTYGFVILFLVITVYVSYMFCAC